MKYLFPFAIALLLFASVFAIFKFMDFKKSGGDSSVSVVGEEAVSGNPEDVAGAILQSAEAEAVSTSDEDGELLDVAEDVNQVSALEDVYNDNEY